MSVWYIPVYLLCKGIPPSHLKGSFCDPDMLFLRHNSVDVTKISFFPNFQSIQRFHLQVMYVLLSFCCIGHCVGNYLCQQICKKYLYKEHKLYIQSFCWCKNEFFFGEKWEAGVRLWITKWTFNNSQDTPRWNVEASNGGGGS